jgi:pantetheine-phosphate adenylyltransferase
VDFARSVDAGFILRGLRSVSDFEYEHNIADANRKISGIETVILFTDYEYSYISSTVVRDLIVYGKDISIFLPPNVKI